LLRPAQDVGGNAGSTLNDPQCRADVAQHDGSDLTVPPQTLLAVYANQQATAHSWAISHSLFLHIKAVNRPVWIAQQYQDEQTGPRGGPMLWQEIPPGVPKRLLLTNGLHTTNHLFNGDREAWLVCWVIRRGRHCGPVADPRRRVEVFFETTGPGSDWAADHLNRPLGAADFPLPQTRWTRYYLRADHTLTTSPLGGDGALSYLSSTADRQTTGDLGLDSGLAALEGATFTPGVDELRWTLRFPRPTALIGPIDLTLWARSTASDTDFFVDLLDRDSATGALTYLQRGLLRTSFRALDWARSDRVKRGPQAGAIYRPYHPFVDPQPLTPGVAYRFEIEIFPPGMCSVPDTSSCCNCTRRPHPTRCPPTCGPRLNRQRSTRCCRIRSIARAFCCRCCGVCRRSPIPLRTAVRSPGSRASARAAAELEGQCFKCPAAVVRARPSSSRAAAAVWEGP